MKPIVTMRAALYDPDLFGRMLDGESWAAWRALLIAAMGEELTDAERAIFEALTGREREPLERVDELWAIVGRRGGKTRSVGVAAAYIAALCDHADKLAPGERGVLPIMSASVWQSQKAFGFLSGIFAEVPTLAGLVENETADTLSLTNRIDIECRPASFRTVRGSTFVAAIADELAFWRSDETSRNPDAAILAAARPALATTGGPLIVISSPYAQSGELWNTYKRDFGAAGDPLVLVAKAPSRTMNPTLSQKVVDRAMERDAAAARAEFLAEFRDDVAGVFDAETVEAAIDDGVIVRPRREGVQYEAAADPSGGKRDGFTLAISHRDGDLIVLDCLVERKPPFNPEEVVKEYAATLRSYGVSTVTGDKYAGAWVSTSFERHGIKYKYSDYDRSQIYLNALPLFTSGRVRLLDDRKLVLQLVGLERRTVGGRDKIDHAPNQHDDKANAAALALTLASLRREIKISFGNPASQIGGIFTKEPLHGWNTTTEYMVRKGY